MSNERPIFTVRFRPEPRIDGIKALRALLKAALRRFGLRAIHITEEAPTKQTNDQQQANDRAKEQQS
jgi:hypothetical protein